MVMTLKENGKISHFWPVRFVAKLSFPKCILDQRFDNFTLRMNEAVDTNHVPSFFNLFTEICLGVSKL